MENFKISEFYCLKELFLKQKINLFIVRQSIKKDITKFQKNFKIFKNIFSRIILLGLFINVKIPFLNF